MKNEDKGFKGVKVGDFVEAQEKEIWYRAKVTHVFPSQSEFRIHYLGWNKKWDKTLHFGSNIVRWPTEEAKTESAKFEEGQKVMAPFADNHKYPATVIKRLDHNKTYTVKEWVINVQIIFFHPRG